MRQFYHRTTGGILLLGLLLFGCGEEVPLTANDHRDAPDEYEVAEYRWGFADKTGQLKIPARFDEVRNFGEEGLALVRRDEDWYFIDRNAKKSSRSYSLAWPFREGRARVRLGADSIGFIDRRDRLVIPAAYADAGDFRNGLAWVRRGELHGLIDRSGRVVLPLTYEKITPLEDGTFLFLRDGNFGMMDEAGEEVLPPAYERLKVFGENELAPARSAGRYGYLNRDNEWVFPPVYLEASAFVEERAVVRANNEKLRLIDAEGNDYHREDYDQLFYGNQGRWIVEKDGYFGAIDAEGRIVIPLQFTELQPAADGYMVYRQGEGWGFLDALDGTPLTPPAFGLAWPFRNGLARIVTQRGFTFLDTLGEYRFPPQYLDLKDGAMGLIPVQVYEP